MEKKALRNSSLELLRIITMIMITFHHFAYHGGFKWEVNDINISHLWYNLMLMGGKIGVNVFVLISGYFLITDDGPIFNFKKIIKFWGQIFFYSIVIFIIFAGFGLTNLGTKDIIYTFLPITYSQWWFASTYFILFLLHPFLNKLLNSINKSLYQTLLVTLFIIWSVVPTLTTSQNQSNYLWWFVTLYAIAGYARLYGFNKKFTCKHYFIAFIIGLILTYATSVVFMILGLKIKVFFYHSTYFFDQETIPILLTSISFFMAFATLKMNYHKWINIIATGTFAVYLIQDHRFTRNLFWMDIFKNAKYQNSLMLIPYSILVVAVLFVGSIVIDLIRQNVFEKSFMKVVNKFIDSLLKPLERICNSFKSIVFGEK